ncbi:MAG: signal peptidase II [Spirochaetes bacterium]|nr:signal peptidase II [Spirochaetota bacterium]
MKKYFNYLRDNSNSIIKKAVLLLLFVLIFTGSDLIIKQIAYKNLKNKPDVIVIPGFWRFHYEINDDIGFSALRSFDKYLGAPQKIKVEKYESKILNKLENDYQKRLLKNYYAIDNENKFYKLNDNINKNDKMIIRRILGSIGYKTGKWLLLVIIQGLATLVVIVFFFYSKLWRLLFPLALILSGALGNVIDRIIRGYVIDYVMWTFKFIPCQLFNPWPIFNLADVCTVIGAISLFIVLFFFSKEELK